LVIKFKLDLIKGMGVTVKLIYVAKSSGQQNNQTSEDETHEKIAANEGRILSGNAKNLDAAVGIDLKDIFSFFYQNFKLDLIKDIGMAAGVMGDKICAAVFGENVKLVVGNMRFNQNVNNTRNSRFNGCLSGSLKIKCVQKILIRS